VHIHTYIEAAQILSSLTPSFSLISLSFSLFLGPAQWLSGTHTPEGKRWRLRADHYGRRRSRERLVVMADAPLSELYTIL